MDDFSRSFWIAFLIPVVTALVVPFIYSRKDSTIDRALVFSIWITISATVLLIYPYESGNFQALFQKILQGQFHLYIALSLLGYVLSLLLLLGKQNKYLLLSFYIHFLTFTLVWIGLLQFGLDVEFQSASDFMLILVFLVACGFILVPLITLGLYSRLANPATKIDLTEKDFYQIRVVKSFVAKLFILTVIVGSLVIFLVAIVNDEPFIVDILVIFALVYILKALQAIRVYGVDFDFKNRTISFHKTFGKQVFKAGDIKTWSIKEYITQLKGLESDGFIEIELVDGRHISYPILSAQFFKIQPPIFHSAFEKLTSTKQPIQEPEKGKFFSRYAFWPFFI